MHITEINRVFYLTY